MIDWGNLLANSLWIMGCALALATLSFASWQASIHAEKLSAQLSKPGFQSTLILAGVLFCAGQIILAGALLLRILWSVLGILLLLALLRLFKIRDASR